MMKETACCFTGHRRLPADQIEIITKRLEEAVESLIAKGVTGFLCGGALGFDMLAATVVLSAKERGKHVRLILALPCKDQDAFWNEQQKAQYRSLLEKVDEVVYVSEAYYDGCMKKRNLYMIDHCAYCVCALSHPRSGTGQTVRMARDNGVQVINVMSCFTHGNPL